MEYALSNGIMDLAKVVEILKMQKTDDDYLSMHHNRIYYDEKLKKYRTLINDGTGKKVQVKRSTEESVIQAVIEHYKDLEDSNKLSVGKAMKEYVEYHFSGETKQATKERNLADIKRYFGEIVDERLERFSISKWEVYLEDYVKKNHPKRRGFSNALCLLRKTLIYHRKRGNIDIDVKRIFEELEISSDDYGDEYKEDSQEIFNAEECKILTQYLWDNHTDPVCLLLLLQYFTGIRVGEAMALRHEDVFDDYLHIHSTAMGLHHDASGKVIRSAVKKTPKTMSGIRKIPFSEGSEKLVEALRAMNPESEYIFVNSHGEIFSRNAVGCKLNRICDKLGMPRRSPHKLRKTFCSILKENGMDDASVTALMGHADIATTNAFYVKNRNDVGQLRGKVTVIPSLDMSSMVSDKQNP